MERHCANFFTPTQAIGGRQLSTQEVTWNEWLQLVRSRVEHLNTVVKNHRMINGEPYRDWVRNLKVFLKISTHGAAAQLQASAATRLARYDGFGPWAHCP